MKWILQLSLLLTACGNEKVENKSIEPIHHDQTELVKESDSLDKRTSERFALLNLVDILSINASIQVDLKYATTDNFMGIILYDTIHKLYLQKDVALRLSKCQDTLKLLKPGYSLLLFDGVRPVQVQQEMWDALDSVPIFRRGKFVSNPSLGSVHNFGAAVDLTIVNEKGIQLDMGAGYDDFSPIAFPSKELYFLKKGDLTMEQVENRQFLRMIMASQKFRNIPSEWWHFNGTSRINASYKYQLLWSESGDAIWFKIAPKKVVNDVNDVNDE